MRGPRPQPGPAPPLTFLARARDDITRRVGGAVRPPPPSAQSGGGSGGTPVSLRAPLAPSTTRAAAARRHTQRGAARAAGASVLQPWRVAARTKEVDGLLRADEIANLREAYGITQSQAARLFGGGPVAFSKYENNDVAQSESMDILLRLVRHSREAFDRLVAQRGMTAEISGAATTPCTLRLISNSTKSTYTIEDKDGGSSPNYNPREFRTYGRSVWPQSNP